MEIRADQIEFAVRRLERDYQAFGNLRRRPWMSPADKAEVRKTLEASLNQAQQMLQCLGQPGPGRSPELQHWQSKLILWVEMSAADLKATAGL